MVMRVTSMAGMVMVGLTVGIRGGCYGAFVE